MVSVLSEKELAFLDAYWRAANYLSVGQIYLRENPLLRDTAGAGAHQDAFARALGHEPRAELRLRSPEPGHPEARPRHDLRLRARPRRSGHGREHLPRRHVQRALPARLPGRRRPSPPLPAVLVPRRDSEPRGPRDARLHPRGRGAWLRAGPRLRRRVRQPGPGRRVRDRGRRSRDGAARGGVALEQVPQSGDGRGGAADPPSERLQDREPDRSWPGSAAPSWRVS